MEILDFFEKTGREIVLSLGLFDSVHRAHCMLLSLAREKAEAFGAEAAVFHFTGTVKRMPLYTEKERFFFMEETGVKAAVCAPFERIRSLSGEEFFRILTENYRIRGIVCGYDYRFGAGAACGVKELEEFTTRAGIPLFIVERQAIRRDKISTTAIKNALSVGDPEGASVMLGRQYSVTGKVQHGYEIGRTMGFPTANIGLQDRFLPRKGVYIVRAEIDGKKWYGLANLGSAPTLDHNKTLLEVHFDGFSGDLYDRELTVDFLTYYRDIVKFPSREALGKQLESDVLSLRAYVKENDLE